MKKYIQLPGLRWIFTLLIITGCGQADKKETGSSLNSYAQFKELFSDPPAEYRSAPLWDWNDSITEEGITFQLQQFKNAGIGGVFVHPRPGLITEYLSDNWNRLFAFTVRKGRELGLRVWIYDENSYPSGFAGGHVPVEMPDSYQHGTGLSFQVLDVFNIEMNDRIEVVLKQAGNEFKDITKNTDREKGKIGKYYIFKRTFPPTSLWYGGKTYVDLLYPGVTEKFMEITMRGYEQYTKDEFGATVPGIFTDEPNLEAAMGPGTVLRWTPDLWDAFKSRWGYDLKVNLPSLVEETGDWKKVRHDFYELILEMFIDRWAKPCFEYCEENNLLWTGHYWEHGWPYPTHGFDEAAFYIWHEQPGVDMLGSELIDKGQGGQFGNIRAARELLSAANQAGRNRKLSETYGGGGYDMNFRNFKRLVDWEVVMGVNFVNQHLSYYSMKGVRKFDYPPSFSYHEPWWDYYKKMGDYIGRISMAMSAGEQRNTTLVLQPNTSAWMYFSRTAEHESMKRIQHDFKDFVYQLEIRNIEYDLGSEYVLKTLGSIRGGNLVAGKRAYDLVVIPASMENIDNHTLGLLKQFLAAGGKILSFNPAIERVDGSVSEDAAYLKRKYTDNWITAGNLDDPQCRMLYLPSEFSAEVGSSEIYHQRRILDDGQLLFFVNSDDASGASAKINVKGTSLVKLDLESGRTFLAPSTVEKGMLSFTLKLGPVGSALYFVSKGNEDEPGLPAVNTAWKPVAAERDMMVRPESENVLVLNYLDLETPKSTMKDTYFMTAQVSLFRENGIEFGNPWQHKIQYKNDYLALDRFSEGTGFTAQYHFQIAAEEDLKRLTDLKVVVERPELWSVSINGNPVGKEEGKYWIDKDFPVFNIGEYLQPGKNTITLSARRMSIFAELMPVYIIGTFRVFPKETGFEIGYGSLAIPGSWIDAGYIFYSGKVAYTRKFNIVKGPGKFKVKLNRWNGTVAEVLVNRNSAGIIAWPPEELDITDLLNNGENEISVRITGSLKNTFGQFFEPEKLWINGPHEWNKAPEHQPGFDQYHLPDYGMFEAFELLVSE